MRAPQVQARVTNTSRGRPARKQVSTERYNKRTNPSPYHEHCVDGTHIEQATVIRNALEKMNQHMKGVSPTRHVNAAFDSAEWSSTHLKSKLVQIDQYLDIDKLIQDIRKQDKDSYGIRCLLGKVKEHSRALL